MLKTMILTKFEAFKIHVFIVILHNSDRPQVAKGVIRKYQRTGMQNIVNIFFFFLQNRIK